MTAEDAKDDPQGRAGIVQFPHSRVTPAHRSFDPDAPIVVGAMANILGIPSEQTTGHWCSRCHKVWFGYLLEVSCPLCGNRHG